MVRVVVVVVVVVLLLLPACYVWLARVWFVSFPVGVACLEVSCRARTRIVMFDAVTWKIETRSRLKESA